MELVKMYINTAQSLPFVMLVVFILMDIVTGNVKAFVRNEYKSGIGISGTLKHLSLILFSLLVPPLLNLAFDVNNIDKICYIYFCSQYMVSIIENFASMGVKMPDFFMKNFRGVLDETQSLKDKEEKNEKRF